jgi:hypothetical protein
LFDFDKKGEKHLLPAVTNNRIAYYLIDMYNKNPCISTALMSSPMGTVDAPVMFVLYAIPHHFETYASVSAPSF